MSEGTSYGFSHVTVAPWAPKGSKPRPQDVIDKAEKFLATPEGARTLKELAQKGKQAGRKQGLTGTAWNPTSQVRSRLA
jgi:hypothetical protein